MLEKYRDLPVAFADASLFALCERLGSVDAAGVAKDFTIYRSQNRRFFNKLFIGGYSGYFKDPDGTVPYRMIRRRDVV